MFNARNKVALVTGATGGIGEATVNLLLKCNASVVATGRSIDKLNSTYRNHKKVYSVQADFSNEDDAKSAIMRAEDKFHSIDYVIHCAGAVGEGSLSNTSLKQWYEILDINLTSAFLLSRESYPALKKSSGSLVLLSSVNGSHGGSAVSGPAYAISKAGINNMTRYLAKEWAKDDIRVNCVSPGPVDTPMLDRLTSDQHKNAKAATLLGKYSTAEECAGLIVFLCSPWAQSMTGTIENISSGIILD